MAFERFRKEHIALTKVIEKYFGADAGYLDISCLDVARVVIEAGWENPRFHVQDNPELLEGREGE